MGEGVALLRLARRGGPVASAPGPAETALQSLFERESQLLERLAIRRGGGERRVERARQAARQIAAAALERLDPLADPTRRGGGRRAAHRVDAAEGLVEHERERIEIGLLADVAPLALLRRHIGERAEHAAGACQGVLAGETRAAEVGELGRPPGPLGLSRHEHVVRLDVAMDDAARMCVGERIGECEADLEHVLVGKRAAGDQLGECIAVDQLADQVEGVVDCAGLVQRDDRRVRQARGGQRLARRPLAVPVGTQPDPLDGDLAMQELVAGAPHLAEAAAAESLEQLVAAEDRALGGDRQAGRGRPSRPGSGPSRTLLGRGGLPRRGRVKKGARRLHRVLRSPSAGPLPAPRRTNGRPDRELA